jgi:hypothetical protein
MFAVKIAIFYKSEWLLRTNEIGKCTLISELKFRVIISEEKPRSVIKTGQKVSKIISSFALV